MFQQPSLWSSSEVLLEWNDGNHRHFEMLYFTDVTLIKPPSASALMGPSCQKLGFHISTWDRRLNICTLYTVLWFVCYIWVTWIHYLLVFSQSTWWQYRASYILTLQCLHFQYPHYEPATDNWHLKSAAEVMLVTSEFNFLMGQWDYVFMLDFN